MEHSEFSSSLSGTQAGGEETEVVAVEPARSEPKLSEPRARSKPEVRQGWNEERRELEWNYYRRPINFEKNMKGPIDFCTDRDEDSDRWLPWQHYPFRISDVLPHQLEHAKLRYALSSY